MARFLGSVTQGAADAFAQGTVVTGLEGQTTQAFRIQRIEVEFDYAAIFALTAGNDIEVALSRRSKTAMPSIQDVDVIKKFHPAFALVTSGAAQQNNILEFVPAPGEDIILVEDPIFLDIDSTATGIVQTALLVVTYEIVTISQIDRLLLITQSLV